MANLQHQLDAAKYDNSKARCTLKHVLASYKKMQAALDAVQTELGHKDTEISNLRKDMSQAQQKIQMLETELEHCQAKPVAMGRQQSSQVEPLCKALESARTENKQLVLHLEEVLQVSNTLQSKLIQTEIEGKSFSSSKKPRLRKEYVEHLESLKKQFLTEQEAYRKAACQESAEEIESELRKMEAREEEYQTKNYEKSQDIQKRMSVLKSVQSEMQVVLKKQHEVQVQNRQLGTQLEVERRRRQQLENKCQVKWNWKKTVKHLKNCTEEAEKKLKEASMEPVQEWKTDPSSSLACFLLFCQRTNLSNKEHYRGCSVLRKGLLSTTSCFVDAR
ncbi:coiled-coil domain-containing protein 150 [Falco naumanni]|uniref:coiled-coil domain-containing protein 150 n=1 Tax=Falco naumanni TaxID=148594 RepID=UPI001ADE479F|nr:coiled-coil domain-containing protein 150 [Falco naumanni]